MSETRPKLKIKPGGSSIQQEPVATPSLTTLSTSTPKITLKFGGKKSPQTPVPQSQPEAATSALSSTKPKSVRKPKPTPKKRALEADPSDNEDEEDAASSQPQIKRIKLKARAPSLPMLHLKTRGKPPKRPRGVGYDSEASDRENDPTISESIILRMAPGPDCDTLSQAIAENNIGSRKSGGVDVRIRFLRTDCRRSVVTINGRHYAACMVDLPCIIEAMKSWFPKSGWIKSADICQMLIVLGPIKVEEEAMTYPLPGVGKGELDEKTWQYAHGVTPPMRWVRKRRFRKRISVRTVMEVEAVVEALLRADAEAEGDAKFELIDERKLESESDDEELYDEHEQDAEGDEDLDQSQYIQTVEGVAEPEKDEEEAAARLAAEMEAGMMDDLDEDTNAPETLTSAPPVDSPAALNDTATPPSTTETPVAGFTPSADATPAGAVDTSSAAEDESEEESDEDEDVDEDQLEKQQEKQRQQEEIDDLEDAIKGVQEQLAKQANPLLRKRLGDKIRDLQRDLEVKRGGGEEGGEE